ncbi:uncharacterized protein BDZ99DRAFT_572364 [Mytilinidion resinicola]|uniref:Trafficking protein particle complex subunit 11 n=1 Tax=Mytilinidion resinicola TaxID=574789 RepID=A0A6A6YIW8_9PEZI|nr:uncharacterized protein BDZ99DRAFT_572364 [Mytilinidion resinicola]KAF2808509.1 hypothetical protein BDZ99DRAFT_572364 [Mytilinidion resinicola]
MDAYPPEYIAHNLPLIVLSGLGSTPELEAIPPVQDVLLGRRSTPISSELPPVTGQRADQLLQEFLSTDARDAAWNNVTETRKGAVRGFRIRPVGRDFMLPPRKADPPENPDGLSPPGSPTVAPTPTWILHSPISPLSPESAIFPDGVMSVAWTMKHQYYIPSFFISFFDFTSDPSRNSLHDNQLKTEINKIKGQLQISEHRTRYAVVLISDKSILESTDIEERLSTIRRATGLDATKGLFFLPPNSSRVELASFAQMIVTTLKPLTTEYYRDLTKHARRKKGRSQIPAPTAPPTRGTSQTLAQQGWAVRYDFKLGIFAEFRQEMDAAQRHYQSALDNLFGPDGVFETTANWSPRWDENRLLADAIAIRNIRCLLWNKLPTAAVQAWLIYKSRVRSLLDRRGKGTANYGWEAWESRWAKAMSQLIQRAEMPIFAVKDSPQDSSVVSDRPFTLFSPPEKVGISQGERLSPWHLLHHSGYWLRLSAKHAQKRRLLAEDIPDEDRTPPGLSPATQVSHRYTTYDHYLVPEPHVEYALPENKGYDHCSEIIDIMNQAAQEFFMRGQYRVVDQLNLDTAKELIHAKRYADAESVLRPLWEGMIWRKERWYPLVGEATWALRECAMRVQDPEILLATEWELLSSALPPKLGHSHNLMTCLDAFPVEEGGKPTVTVSADKIVSCLAITFTFFEGDGNVGEPLPSQIAVTSNARLESAPLTLSKIMIRFKGCLSEVQLLHTASTSERSDGPAHYSVIKQLDLEETAASSRSDQKPLWSGGSDLTIYPGQTKVFAFAITFRDAGEVNVLGSILEIETERFNLVCSSTMNEGDVLPSWWIKGSSTIKAKKLSRTSGIFAQIHPKPPKMEIALPNLLDHYYTDEAVTLDIEIINKEEETTEAVLEVRLLGLSTDTLEYSWVPNANSANKEPVKIPASDSDSQIELPGHVVGRLERNARRTETIKFKAPDIPSGYALEIKVLYHLLSDEDIPISKTLTTDLVFDGPFEASYEFSPRVHPDPWPSMFEVHEGETGDAVSGVAGGIAQRWHLKAKVASFAEEVLIIEETGLELHEIHGGAVCDISKEFPSEGIDILPQELQERSFSLDMRKIKFEERRSAALDMGLSITWRRKSENNSDSPAITSVLAMPRLHLPSSEPRVLASVTQSLTVQSFLTLHLDYTLENPTTHSLTFEVSMEASEDFAFAGSKLQSLIMLPFSRQTVHYNLVPMVKGAWIMPQLRVVDRYFNKTLKIQPTGDIKMDKKGILIWVDDDE